MKNKVLIAAVAIIGLASVAYASFTQLLTINGTGTATGSWDVKITGITRTSATGVTDASAPTFTNTSATFSSNLQYPGATATYRVVVTNNGTIPAILSTINGLSAANSAVPTYITYAINGVTANTTTLAANGGTNNIDVTVTWDSASAPLTSGATKTATLDFTYNQNT